LGIGNGVAVKFGNEGDEVGLVPEKFCQSKNFFGKGFGYPTLF